MIITFCQENLQSLLVSGESQADHEGSCQGEDRSVYKWCGRVYLYPEETGYDTGREQGYTSQSGLKAQHGAFELRRGYLSDEGSLHARGHGCVNAVNDEDGRHHRFRCAEGEGEIDDGESYVSADQQLLPADPVGKPAARDSQDRSRSSVYEVEKDGAAAGKSRVLGSEEQEAVGRVSQRKYEGDRQVELEPAVQLFRILPEWHTLFFSRLARLLFYEEEYEEGDQDRDHGYREHSAIAGLAQLFHYHEGREYADRRSQHIQHLMDSEGLAHVSFLCALGDHHVSRRCAYALAEAVGDSAGQHSAPARRQEQDDLVDDSGGVARECQRLFMAEAVAQVSAEYHEQAGQALCYAFYDPDQSRGGAQDRRKVKGDDRVDHFRRNIRETADQPEEYYVPEAVETAVPPVCDSFHDAAAPSILYIGYSVLMQLYILSAELTQDFSPKGRRSEKFQCPCDIININQTKLTARRGLPSAPLTYAAFAARGPRIPLSRNRKCES